MKDTLLILDLDHVNSRTIARKLRAERIDCRIVPGNTATDAIAVLEPRGLVIACSPTGNPPVIPGWSFPANGIPVLALGNAAGVLFGRSIACQERQATVPAVKTVDFSSDPLTRGMENSERLLCCYCPDRLPDGWLAIARTDGYAVGYRHADYPVYGMQFSVEQNDPDGIKLLVNFAVDICGCTQWWDEQAFVEGALDVIRRKAGGRPAVCAMTGGLSSGVAAMLAHKALNGNFRCLFIDTGLLRESESDDVMAYYRDQAGIDVTLVPAQERFLTALAGLEEPKAKRQAVSKELQAILDEETGKAASSVIIRGTNYSDILANDETRPSIQSGVDVIEPVRELFRDEIRRIGEFIGMPQHICARQPFPGTGLAMRIQGEANQASLDTLRAADAIFQEEVELSHQSKKLLHHFAVLGSLQGIGPVIYLRAVHAGEGETAYAARLPYDLLERIVERIMRIRPEVRRVFYDLTPGKGYCGAEWL